jgi:hypothetical protein
MYVASCMAGSCFYDTVEEAENRENGNKRP